MSTYAKQHAVPRLPVPDLDQTLAKYLRTVGPLCDPAVLRSTERAVLDSRPQLAALQARLVQGAAAQRNWLERDWDNGKRGGVCAVIQRSTCSRCAQASTLPRGRPCP